MMSLDNTSPALLQALQKLGDEYGPLGVAETAAQMSSIPLLIQRLKNELSTSEGPAPTPQPLRYEDSRPETYKHIIRVIELLQVMAGEILARGPLHDKSKTEDPEKAVFDEYTPKLKTSTYGTEEYKGFLQGMSSGLEHHYSHNRHHPEYYTRGINGMTLIDLVEMICDWKAATERHDDGDILFSIEVNTDRFSMSPQLVDILVNTVLSMAWAV